VNPGGDHGLGDWFGRELLSEVTGDRRIDSATPEHRFESEGTIDLLLHCGEMDLGLEAKIWDRSAHNKAKDVSPNWSATPKRWPRRARQAYSHSA
jgi:hypothetical protein